MEPGLHRHGLNLIKAANVDSLDVNVWRIRCGPIRSYFIFTSLIFPPFIFSPVHMKIITSLSDDIEKINADGMEKVANLATRFLRGLGNNGRDKIEFTKPKMMTRRLRLSWK
jgi:hypothetical protein